MSEELSEFWIRNQYTAKPKTVQIAVVSERGLHGAQRNLGNSGPLMSGDAAQTLYPRTKETVGVRFPERGAPRGRVAHVGLRQHHMLVRALPPRRATQRCHHSLRQVGAFAIETLAHDMHRLPVSLHEQRPTPSLGPPHLADLQHTMQNELQSARQHRD